MPCRMSLWIKSWINTDKIWFSAIKYWWMMSVPTQKHFPLSTPFLLKMCHVMEVKCFVIVISRSLFCRKIQAVITFQPFLCSLKNPHTEQMVGDVWLVNCSRCKTSHMAHLMLETLKGYIKGLLHPYVVPKLVRFSFFHGTYGLTFCYFWSSTTSTFISFCASQNIVRQVCN